ncbi:DUF6376 family protein [Ectobacillus ponti]|uniref:DUF6376 family protein n=1 Tax=Ectobacillus ponti TaxID=2961894 RepID=A0AA42BRH1_9BACI|nr:DUF6376 family protein [Ectobacillus ponti]MCP8970391.1 DUF6376 family protein [Ectobacillus ponti]
MKKWLAGATLGSLLLMGGCSLLQEANSTLTYVNEATGYINDAGALAQEVSDLVQQAVTDKTAAKELQTKLQKFQQELKDFNQLKAPDVAADLHQQVVTQNEKLNAGIELYLKGFKDGLLDPALAQNPELLQTIQEVSSLIEQIKKLGQ